MLDNAKINGERPPRPDGPSPPPPKDEDEESALNGGNKTNSHKSNNNNGGAVKVRNGGFEWPSSPPSVADAAVGPGAMVDAWTQTDKVGANLVIRMTLTNCLTLVNGLWFDRLDRGLFCENRIG